MYQILILTPDADDAAALRSALENAHDGPYGVTWLTRLEQALAHLQADQTDAILVDLHLPDSEGIASFERLFGAAPQVPILTLSTLDDESLALDAVQRGAQGYLSKGHFASYLVPQSLRNIIQRKAIEQRYVREQARAAITLNSISDAVIGTDTEGRIDYLNLAGEQMTGWSAEEAHGRPIGEVMVLLNSTTRQPARNPLEQALQSGGPIQLAPDTIILRRGGREIFIEDSASPIRDTYGRMQGAVMVFHDTTTAQAMGLKMAHLAQHDMLTDLPNRVLLRDRIAQAIVQAQRHETALAVLVLDLDKFKYINDAVGHQIGDSLLQSVAARLCDCVRTTDTVSRIGGDEFVVLASEINQVYDAALTAEKIITALSAPHGIDGRELHITTSIGIALFPDDGDTPETLIKHADTAMYQAKERGRNNYQFFTAQMNALAVERQLIEHDLRRALAGDELVLYYQPKINLASGKLSGAEALVRWNHPDWGITPPQRFIQIAEECGLIIPLGRWVLREACTQAMRWSAAGLDPGSIAVNVSSLEIHQKDFIKGVRQILDETRLARGRLQLEITESVLMQDALASRAQLMELKALGVELAIDDFGTGYSSLSYLLQFPIDVLKIDQSFVRNITAGNDDGAIVSAIIGMGNNLRQRVIAEGVENAGQLDFLKRHHCDEGQGFLFGHPVGATAFTGLLAHA
jgi:diguanylate cyclase (GGDEF)-like protein/PAS domain S-box-containing protein